MQNHWTTWKLCACTLMGALFAAGTTHAAITELYSNSAGAVSLVTAGAVTGNMYYVVTAVRNGGGELELIVWHDTGTALERMSSINAGPVSLIALATNSCCFPGTLQLVTAVNANSGVLELISWEVNDQTGVISRQGTYFTTVTPSEIAATFISNSKFATAVRDLTGKLNLSTWNIDAQGTISPFATITGGPVNQIALANAEGISSFALATTDANGTITVTGYRTTSTKLTKLGSATGGAAVLPGLAIAFYAFANRQDSFATASRDGAGNLQVQDWTMSSAGVTAGQIASYRPVTSLAISSSFGEFFTATESTTGDLGLQSWSPAPALVDSYTSSTAITATSAAYSLVNGGNDSHYFTASRTAAGNLLVQDWSWY